MSAKIVRLAPKQMTLDDFVSRALQGIVRHHKLTSITEAWDFLTDAAYTSAGYDMDGLTEGAISVGRLFAGAQLSTTITFPPGKTLEAAKPSGVERSWQETLQRLNTVRAETGLDFNQPF